MHAHAHACPQVWSLDSIPPGGAPQLLRAFKAFPASSKSPDTDVTAMQVHEDAWPHFTIALGMANSQVHIIRGDIG
jgi:hypothetical protein